MIQCDGCAGWFHDECVDDKKDERPRPEAAGAAWFCSSCFLVFTEVKEMKIEVTGLTQKLNKLMEASQNKQSCSCNTSQEMDNFKFAKGPKVSDENVNNSKQIEELQSENLMLKNHLKSVNKLLNVVLDNQNTGN